MAVSIVPIALFLELSKQGPVLDVRSPGEFNHAHIPGACSLPLFTDEERKVIGTTYKQQSREAAIRKGLDYFGPKMRTMVELTENYLTTHAKPAAGEKAIVCVHCWRGGMRSDAVAWLLDLYGFRVYKLEGGYKTYRHWVLGHFSRDYNFKIIGGYTGSAKTEVLQQVKARGRKIIDLEGIANHKGSAFGGLDKPVQPRQEMFENLVAAELDRLLEENPQTSIWVEDESQRIGDLNLPIELWKMFRRKPLFFLDVPFDARLDYITHHYGKHSTESLVNAMVRIKKRLGPMETKTAIGHLVEGDVRSCFAILLKYYDKHYIKALHNRPDIDTVMRTIPCTGIDPKAHAITLLNMSPDDTRIQHG